MKICVVTSGPRRARAGGPAWGVMSLCIADFRLQISDCRHFKLNIRTHFQVVHVKRSERHFVNLKSQMNLQSAI
jgi:hypothetical protein